MSDIPGWLVIVITAISICVVVDIYILRRFK